MNTLEIYSFVHKDTDCSRSFIGVYSRDQLPRRLYRFPCSFIVNTDKQNEPGEHWLAFYYDENRHATFFDPCGLSPSVYGLEAFLHRTANTWTYNSKRIQSFFSVLCGQICLFFIYFKSKRFSLNYITSLFSNNYEDNEKIILNFFKNLFFE